MRKILIGLAGLIGFMGLTPINPANSFLPINAVHAQDSNRITLQVDVQHFFIDNEYIANRIDGYTLPGFVLRPYVSWQVNPKVELQIGANWLHYWGNTGFPKGPLNEIRPAANDTVDAIHLLPWMQAKISFTPEIQLVIGSLVNTDGHGLPYPLYNPERIYAVDPESGLQMLFDYRHLKADIWVDWRNFIWQHSNTQEVFNAGLSLLPRWPVGDKWEMYLPLHVLVQHHGGQALTDRNMGHDNRWNSSAGIGLRYSHKDLALSAEAHAMYYCRTGESEGTLVYDEWGCLRSYPLNFKQGWGGYALLRTNYRNSELEMSYWASEKFVPLLGLYHFSNISSNTPNITFDRIQVITLRGSHTVQLGVCDLTLLGGFHYYFPYTGDRKDYWKCYMPDTGMFSLGCLINIHPSITLLR